MAMIKCGYQAVKVPIMGTSSAYYARIRESKQEPEKYCMYCGERLHRWYNTANGRWEHWGNFMKRKCCDNVCAQRLRREGCKADREKQIPNGYKPCRECDGLYVNYESEFIYNGKCKKVIKHIDRYGRKHTAKLLIRRDGKTCYLSAARLVASAFICSYNDDAHICYKDGDIHNTRADNLRLVTGKEYNSMRCEHAASFRKTSTYQYQVDRLNVSIESNEAVLHYFRTGDFEKVNKHVESYLYNCLLDFCLKSLHFGKEQAPIMAGDAIGHWYEVLLQGHAVGHGERYCKHILVNFKRNGWYGYSGNVPKNKIELIINHLNLDCLWERYKVTKLKR